LQLEKRRDRAKACVSGHVELPPQVALLSTSPGKSTYARPWCFLLHTPPWPFVRPPCTRWQLACPPPAPRSSRDACSPRRRRARAPRCGTPPAPPAGRRSPSARPPPSRRSCRGRDTSGWLSVVVVVGTCFRSSNETQSLNTSPLRCSLLLCTPSVLYLSPSVHQK
jgi:hypothetical protein